MFKNNHLSDMITSIRNGYTAKLVYVKVSNTNLNTKVLQILIKEGYIRGYHILKDELIVLLKYINNKSVILNIHNLSTPSSRLYFKKQEIKENIKKKKLNKLYIISTPEGIRSSKKLRHGGEILVSVN
uniref:Ribosomal protein S8 n=1 Tax=Malawimonas californiana TaxID=221722 RepID=A0A0B5GMV4_MALCL|nr:ribosomal protein S8 [Malawimonas californiana]AJF22878.1 ribosomal protein S8 [Malawimonas californiana]